MNPTNNLPRVAPFNPADFLRGEDGELYHLPTLRALNAAGRLPQESEGFRLLMAQVALEAPRLIA